MTGVSLGLKNMLALDPVEMQCKLLNYAFASRLRGYIY